MTMPLTLFHTGDVHIAPFSRLFAELAPEVPLRHEVRADLLQEAQDRGGLTAEIRRRAMEALLRAAETGAPVVLCTCSTIGPAAEDADAASDATILRVDRPMAERAVASGRRIVIAACVPTTIGPTRELLLSAAAAAGEDPELREFLVPDAWPHFVRGDQEAYWKAIAAALPGAVGDADVMVLAQASMAGAVALCEGISIPVLSSPRLGVEAAVASYRAAVG